MTGVIEMEADSVFGDPANLDGRIANDKGIWLYWFGYNCTSAHKCIFANVVAADNGGIGADGCP